MYPAALRIGVLLAVIAGVLPGCDDDNSADQPAAEPDRQRADAPTSPTDQQPTDTLVDDSPESDTADARQVLLEYYEAINGGDFRRAYELWGNSGEASGESLENFTRGFANTDRTTVEIGEAGRVEGAAGSRYVDFPVVVRAITSDGVEQRFEGQYVLRRSVVDGATTEQRAWRIYEGTLAPVP